MWRTSWSSSQRYVTIPVGLIRSDCFSYIASLTNALAVLDVNEFHSGVQVLVRTGYHGVFLDM